MVIYHLTHGKRVNLQYLIIQHMISALKDNNENVGLPYSMALTKIFKEFKLSFIGEEAERHWKPFNSKNVSHIKLNSSDGALGLHQIPIPREEFLKVEEEENPLHSLVNAIIVESHRTSQFASLNSKNSSKFMLQPLISISISLLISISHLDLELHLFLSLLLLCLMFITLLCSNQIV